MKPIFIALLILFICVGCTRTQLTFHPMAKDGVDDQQKRKDVYECKKEAVDFKSKQMAGVSHYDAHSIPAMRRSKRHMNEVNEESSAFYIECMELRGYHKVEAK